MMMGCWLAGIVADVVLDGGRADTVSVLVRGTDVLMGLGLV